MSTGGATFEIKDLHKLQATIREKLGKLADGKKVTTYKLVFGGPSADYAAAVHENLTAKHRVGQAKFLESVVKERRGRLAQELAARTGTLPARLRSVAELWMTEAKRRTPVQFGTLRSSGHVAEGD